MESYHDFYGCHACLRVNKDGTARLTVRTSSGKLIHAKNYKSRKGARIAMGRMSETWKRII